MADMISYWRKLDGRPHALMIRFFLGNIVLRAVSCSLAHRSS